MRHSNRSEIRRKLRKTTHSHDVAINILFSAEDNAIFGCFYLHGPNPLSSKILHLISHRRSELMGLIRSTDIVVNKNNAKSSPTFGRPRIEGLGDFNGRIRYPFPQLCLVDSEVLQNFAQKLLGICGTCRVVVEVPFKQSRHWHFLLIVHLLLDVFHFTQNVLHLG